MLVKSGLRKPNWTRTIMSHLSKLGTEWAAGLSSLLTPKTEVCTLDDVYNEVIRLRREILQALLLPCQTPHAFHKGQDAQLAPLPL